ncbi:DNA-3-methyladenine glycosylase [Candidatus Bathyarchaeota archaeon]|nr:DNA-3-methyladenine glycosylase [Candidatus Bathyarchaeota archaeon]
MNPLPKSFYERDPALVARELLGKTLVRRLDRQTVSGKIVETEAYYGENDPASKAYKGRKTFNELMYLDVGKAFIYMVHGNWLLNIVAHPKGGVGAVLIRALEPIRGIEVMKKNRGVKDVYALTSGPGRLTKALNITKKQNGLDVTKAENEIAIFEAVAEEFEICTSHRIGVKRDLPKELRFYIKGNKFVSKRENLSID